MLPHAGQGANQAIEDGVALATVLSLSDRAMVARALQAYEAVRREHTAGVQRMARVNGARYDSAGRDLGDQARDRTWVWQSDPEAEAAAAMAGR
jgi:salicylate hydroxylase